MEKPLSISPNELFGDDTHILTLIEERDREGERKMCMDMLTNTQLQKKRNMTVHTDTDTQKISHIPNTHLAPRESTDKDRQTPRHKYRKTPIPTDRQTQNKTCHFPPSFLSC